MAAAAAVGIKVDGVAIILSCPGRLRGNSSKADVLMERHDNDVTIRHEKRTKWRVVIGRRMRGGGFCHACRLIADD